MDSDENIPTATPLDLHSTESQDYIPTEIWSKIISFLPPHDRCRVELVNHQLSEASKATWGELQTKKLWISSCNIDSAAKLATLLRRCGSYLEEIIVERHIQLDNEAQLFQLCPNLKTLTFAGGKSLSLAWDKRQSDVAFYIESINRVERFHEFMPKLERLQLFSSIDNRTIRSPIYRATVSLREMVPGLAEMPNLRELHLPATPYDGYAVSHIGRLEHTRVLSVMVPVELVYSDPTGTFVARRRIRSLYVDAICQLRQLEQLYLRLGSSETRYFDAAVVGRLAKSLPNLNSLVLMYGCHQNVYEIPDGCIDALIGQFAQLRTLVIVCGTTTLENVPVDLNPHRHRQVPLNIFVVDYMPNFHSIANFTGYSPRIRIIPMPNRRYGEAINFLSTYSQNGFDFGAEKCLLMVKRSAQFKGEWDFSYEVDDEKESDAEDN